MTTSIGGPGAPEANADAPDGFAQLARAIEDARADSALERRRLISRLWWWRFGAIAVVLFLIIIAAFGARDPRNSPHIARISITGMIADDVSRDALIDGLGDKDDVKAVIVRIDSPGGTTVGGEALYESIRRLAEKKPVAAVMGETAASAGYIAALATDYVVARGNSLTASVGVIAFVPNFSEAIKEVGVSVKTFRSGDLKATPSMLDPLDAKSSAHMEAIIQDGFQWFAGLVRERRGLSNAQFARISDGRALSGRMALDAGLVDALGGEADAVAWFETERGIGTGLGVYEHSVAQPKSAMSELLETFFGRSAATGGAVGRVLDGPKLWSTID